MFVVGRREAVQARVSAFLTELRKFPMAKWTSRIYAACTTGNSSRISVICEAGVQHIDHHISVSESCELWTSSVVLTILKYFITTVFSRLPQLMQSIGVD